MERGIVAKAVKEKETKREAKAVRKKTQEDFSALRLKPHLSLPLQCSQRKQLLWKVCLSAISDSMGYTLVQHTLHSSDSGTRIFCQKNKRNNEVAIQFEGVSLNLKGLNFLEISCSEPCQVV